MCVEGTLFLPGKRRSPKVGKESAAYATHHSDILFCMSKQSYTCESLKFGELTTKERIHSRKLLRNSHGNFLADCVVQWNRALEEREIFNYKNFCR
jgi:hypothetical protein